MIEYKTSKKSASKKNPKPTIITQDIPTPIINVIPAQPPPFLKPLRITMSSDFSKGVMISLNEHMAQTLLDGMTATIRSEKLDMCMQIQGLEMLVENLEALNARVSEYMRCLRETQEDLFNYDELDLDGLEEWVEGMNVEKVQRMPSPIEYSRKNRTKLASRRLTTLCEEDPTPRPSSRPSFETITSFSSKSAHSASGSITIKVDMPSTPSTSSHEQALFTPSTPAQYRQIDPKKIPKRKPVPTQLQIPQKSNNKAFRRKEVPKRMYEQQGSDASSTTVNTIHTPACTDACGSRGFDSLGAMWTPPVTDEECSPIRDRGDALCIATAATVAANATTMCQPKPRRVKSKQLKISIPRKGSGGKGSGGSEKKSGKLLRTPTSASTAAPLFQKKTMEDLDRAISGMRFSFEESDNGRAVQRMDSGREKRKSIYVSNGSMKRKVSLKTRRRKKYENGIPRCDSPVLGSFEVVFARR